MTGSSAPGHGFPFGDEPLYPSLDTPCVVVDLDVVVENVAEMAGVANQAGVALRPHTKTHKIPALARMQLAYGATGITCAKLGEAEVMADAGCEDILIAFPLWGDSKLRRLRALRERASIRVGVDSFEVAVGLGRLGVESRAPIGILVEVDTGHGRLGRAPGIPTVDLVRQISRIPGVEILGLMTHGGQAYRSASPFELDTYAEREGSDMVKTAELCARDGIEIGVISVGSTPSARKAARVSGVTEIRPGTYIFNDAAMIRLGVASPSSAAVRVVSTVVSRPNPGRIVVDAGTKSLTSDGVGTNDWILAAGRPDVHFEFLTEEHGVATLRPSLGIPAPRVGDRLSIIPSHVCSVMNLFDEVYAVRAGEVVEVLKVAGRGKVN